MGSRLAGKRAGEVIYGAVAELSFPCGRSLWGSSLLDLFGRQSLLESLKGASPETQRLARGPPQEQCILGVLYGRLFLFSNSTVMSLVAK